MRVCVWALFLSLSLHQIQFNMCIVQRTPHTLVRQLDTDWMEMKKMKKKILYGVKRINFDSPKLE